MASKQISQNEFITQSVAKAARMAIQTKVAASTSRQDNAGPKMSGHIMKQSTFNWGVKHKYEEMQNFKLEVSKLLQNIIWARESIDHKELARQRRPTTNKDAY